MAVITQVFFKKRGLEIGVVIRFNCRAGRCDHVQIEAHVVDCREGCREDLVGVEEVVEIGSGEVRTTIAGA